MVGKRKKKVLCLFGCGIIIGFLLEVILVESDIFRRLNLLTQPTKITCLILTKHQTMDFIESAKATWLNHCNDYYIVEIERLPKSHIFADSPDEKSCPSGQVSKLRATSAWGGLCKALHLTKHLLNDWTIVVDDSSLVLVENIRLFVKNLNPENPHYNGYGINHYEADYNALSAGILLSRGSLSSLFDRFKTESDCDRSGKYWRNEDLYLGKYLKELGIVPKDTRDEKGRGRFHGYNLNSLLNPGKLVLQSNYITKALYPVSKGINCCSPFSITFDVPNPAAVYKAYFFLYKLVTEHRNIPDVRLQPKTFFWKDFLREKGFSDASIENMTSEEYYKIWEKILPPEEMYNQMRNFFNENKEDKWPEVV